MDQLGGFAPPPGKPGRRRERNNKPPPEDTAQPCPWLLWQNYVEASGVQPPWWGTFDSRFQPGLPEQDFAWNSTSGWQAPLEQPSRKGKFRAPLGALEFDAARAPLQSQQHMPPPEMPPEMPPDLPPHLLEQGKVPYPAAVRASASRDLLVEKGLPAMSPADFIGSWADSLGNAVSVAQCDAYQLKLIATLSQPPRKDIHLTMHPTPDGSWNCGNAVLDASWSTATQLHWQAADGRVSVWVRLSSEDQLLPER